MSRLVSSSSYWNKKVKPKNANYEKSHPLGSASFLQEDIFICEQLQKSLYSPFFEYGPSANLGESPVREHQNLIWRLIKPYWNK